MQRLQEFSPLLILLSLFITLFVYQRLSRVNTELERQKNKEDDAYKQQEQIQQRLTENQEKYIQQIHQLQQAQQKQLHGLQTQLNEKIHQFRQNFDAHQLNNFNLQQENLQKQMADVRQQITQTLQQHTQTLDQRLAKLTQETDERLQQISGQVEKRLSEGFEKTTATFTDVVKRLAIIDEAQKKITELSGNVVTLQDLLNDKRSRGAFGEVQLNSLLRNVLPENSFSLQHQLSNQTRADCILFLPEPTGNIVIDAKFPLESFRRITDTQVSDSDRQIAQRQFSKDIRKHIQDIATKYIIPGETADGAMMFIPAEAVFAEIHAHHPELVTESQKSRVWLVSPTTMMAILTTARAVLKDDATRQQVHIIQQHLGQLGKDFDRFQERMDKLSRHIHQARDDVELVHKSSKKISSRFQKIEQVELEQTEATLLSHEHE